MFSKLSFTATLSSAVIVGLALAQPASAQAYAGCFLIDSSGRYVNLNNTICEEPPLLPPAPTATTTINPDGTTTVVSPTATTTTLPGTSVSPTTQVPNNTVGRPTVQTTNPDGSTTITNADGTSTVLYPDGRTTTINQNGTTRAPEETGTGTVTNQPVNTIQQPTGINTNGTINTPIQQPTGINNNGRINTPTSTVGPTRISNPDGTTTIIYPNNSQMQITQ